MAKVEDNNIDEVKEEVEKALGKAFTQIGMKWAGYASAKCRTDTGLLRNSITFAVNGHSPNKKTYKASKGDKTGSYGSGIVGGQYPKNMGVTVGTNVEYAPYLEFGTKRMHHAYPYIRPALEEHIDYYQNILETELGKVEVPD